MMKPVITCPECGVEVRMVPDLNHATTLEDIREIQEHMARTGNYHWTCDDCQRQFLIDVRRIGGLN